MSYDKDEGDKAVYDNKVMINYYSWRSFFVRNLWFVKPRFRVINIESRRRKKRNVYIMIFI